MPTETPETRPFWEAAAQDRLLVQHCRECNNWQYPYRGFCSHCWTSGSLEDVVSSGRGTVFTFSVIYRNDTTGFDDVLPYAAAMVELEEDGLLVMTNIVNCDPTDVHIGMPVRALFERVSPERKVVMFEPRSSL